MLEPVSKSKQPICTGTSVLGVTFDEGVAIAADTLASYGRCARFPNVSRLYAATDQTLLGIMGDFADYQFLKNHVENKITELKCGDPDAKFSALAMHSWLTSVLYYRRSKINPLWNTYVVGGLVGEEKKPYLGAVDKLGVAYTNPYIATGLGGYLIQQSLENAYKEKEAAGRGMTEAEAVDLLESSLQTLYYRDCYAHTHFEIGIVTKDGVKILPAKRLLGDWSYAKDVRGYE
jgi:20S proteasome subunit beta 7